MRKAAEQLEANTTRWRLRSVPFGESLQSVLVFWHADEREPPKGDRIWNHPKVFCGVVLLSSFTLAWGLEPDGEESLEHSQSNNDINLYQNKEPPFCCLVGLVLLVSLRTNPKKGIHNKWSLGTDDSPRS